MQKATINYRTAVSPIVSGAGFALPIGIADDRPTLEFKRKVQEEVKLQMEKKRKMLEDYAITELELEKTIIKDDIDQAE